MVSQHFKGFPLRSVAKYVAEWTCIKQVKKVFGIKSNEVIKIKNLCVVNHQ